VDVAEDVKPADKNSAFKQEGFSPTLELVKEEIRELYFSDQIPWVIGYSGGKDSTAVLQLVWGALSVLSKEQLSKPVHVISTDTLVENPLVAAWVSRSLSQMQQAADKQQLPIIPHRLTPEIQNTFWVNLIGRGYPAPRNKFRWCTERLKINPSNRFIREVVRDNGEAILLLGTRRAESSVRAKSMARHAERAIRDRLVPNASLPNSLVYTPIESWTNDDVWTYLMREENPWEFTNKDLLTMYQGATEGGECPLVIDTSTPSCGDSRFGCWVCTLVDQDRSMAAMIQNDDEKDWMLPLLKLRNELDFRGDEARTKERERRDFRRMTGKLTYYTNSVGESQLVHGPYKQDTRAHWLRKVLQTQQWIRENGPSHVRDIELISFEELEEIRRIWVVDKHEIEDYVPAVYQEAVGAPYPGRAMDDNLVFDNETLALLKECCEGNELRFEMLRNLLDTERRFRTMSSRRGLFKALEEVISRTFYDGEEDALKRGRDLHELKHGETQSDEDIQEAGKEDEQNSPPQRELALPLPPTGSD